MNVTSEGKVVTFEPAKMSSAKDISIFSFFKSQFDFELEIKLINAAMCMRLLRWQRCT